MAMQLSLSKSGCSSLIKATIEERIDLPNISSRFGNSNPEILLLKVLVVLMLLV
jgi:hypothetical protein